MATTTKTDRKESVIDVLAYDPELVRLENESNRRKEQLGGVYVRADELRSRLASIGLEIHEASGAEEEKLRKERERLTADLTFLPSDAAIAASLFADALMSWARYIHPRAEQIRHDTALEAEPLRRAISRENEKSSLSLAVSARDEVSVRSAMAMAGDLAEQLTPLADRERAAQNAIHQVQSRLAGYFGDIDGQGVEVKDEQIRRFVAGVSDAVRLRAGASTLNAALRR